MRLDNRRRADKGKIIPHCLNFKDLFFYIFKKIYFATSYQRKRVRLEQFEGWVSEHYENTPMQYTAISQGCKNDDFHMKKM